MNKMPRNYFKYQIRLTVSDSELRENYKRFRSFKVYNNNAKGDVSQIAFILYQSDAFNLFIFRKACWNSRMLNSKRIIAENFIVQRNDHSYFVFNKESTSERFNNWKRF